MHEEIDEVIGAQAPKLTPLERLRHSTAHVMAAAVKRLFPLAKVANGPSIESGFHHDFDVPRPFTDADPVVIDAERQKVVAEDVPFVREAVSRDVARALFAELGEIYNPLMRVCGDKGVAAGELAPRVRDGGKQMPPMPLAEFVQWMENEARIPRHRAEQQKQ